MEEEVFFSRVATALDAARRPAPPVEEESAAAPSLLSGSYLENIEPSSEHFYLAARQAFMDAKNPVRLECLSDFYVADGYGMLARNKPNFGIPPEPIKARLQARKSSGVFLMDDALLGPGAITVRHFLETEGEILFSYSDAAHKKYTVALRSDGRRVLFHFVKEGFILCGYRTYDYYGCLNCAV